MGRVGHRDCSSESVSANWLLVSQGASRFSNQVIAIVATWAWAFAVTAIILWALKATIGLRVSDNDEAVGLDEAEHGEPAYRL